MYSKINGSETAQLRTGKGLSITAIGLRPIEECIGIFRKLSPDLGLAFLELAIGSECDLDRIPDIPLVLHHRCLTSKGRRLPFSLLDQESWEPYIRAARTRNVLAMSVHPPKAEEASWKAVCDERSALEEALGIPVMLEVMPSPAYWCSESTTCGDVPLLIDISHINIWHRGDSASVRKSVERLLPYALGIHLSHNNGRKDSHDLIPSAIWFAEKIESWSKRLLVTYESLPAKYAEYERLDKRRRSNPGNPKGDGNSRSNSEEEASIPRP